MSDILIRRIEEADLPALLDVYNYYVLNTPITFDVKPRTIEQRRVWLQSFAPGGRHQCFVAVRDGEAIGWASSGRFKDRAAYDTSVETSVYLKHGVERHGVGRRLYTALFEALAREDVHRAFAGITQPNEASVAIHEAFGFSYVGTYREVGRKFGRFWDVAWYQKEL
jgi:phosphinothricin acetyltransferase